MLPVLFPALLSDGQRKVLMVVEVAVLAEPALPKSAPMLKLQEL